MLSNWDLPQASPTDGYITITETVLITAIHNWNKKQQGTQKTKNLQKDLRKEFLVEKLYQAPKKAGAYLKHLLGDTLGGRFGIY